MDLLAVFCFLYDLKIYTNGFVFFLLSQATLSTPIQPAALAQSSGAFSFGNFGQTQSGILCFSDCYFDVCLEMSTELLEKISVCLYVILLVFSMYTFCSVFEFRIFKIRSVFIEHTIAVYLRKLDKVKILGSC